MRNTNSEVDYSKKTILPDWWWPSAIVCFGFPITLRLVTYSFFSFFSFTLSNKGDVQLDYHWHFQPLEKPNTVSLGEPLEVRPDRPASSAGQSSQHTGRPSTSPGESSVQPQTRAPVMTQRPGSSMGGRPSSALALAYEAGSVVSEGSDVFPFVIEPETGSIPAGKKGKFSPLDVSQYEAVLNFR